MITIGVDAGGTTLRVAVFDDTTDIGRAEGPGLSMRTGNGFRLAATIADLARPILLRVNVVRADTIVVGAAGAGREAERHELQQALEQQRLAWRAIVTTDAELARAAVFGSGPGVLLIAGTGSIAVARDERGASRRAGGLGWRVGDEGSGYWIASRALEQVGLMHDGRGMVTRLAESLCTAAGVAGMSALIQWSTTATTAQIAALCPAVLESAERGDRVAMTVRTAAVSMLVGLVVAAGGDRMPVAMAGGLLGPGRPMRTLVAAELEALHRSTVQSGPIDACRGAPYLAAEGKA